MSGPWLTDQGPPCEEDQRSEDGPTCGDHGSTRAGAVEAQMRGRLGLGWGSPCARVLGQQAGVGLQRFVLSPHIYVPPSQENRVPGLMVGLGDCGSRPRGRGGGCLPPRRRPSCPQHDGEQSGARGSDRWHRYWHTASGSRRNLCRLFLSFVGVDFTLPWPSGVVLGSLERSRPSRGQAAPQPCPRAVLPSRRLSTPVLCPPFTGGVLHAHSWRH